MQQRKILKIYKYLINITCTEGAKHRHLCFAASLKRQHCTACTGTQYISSQRPSDGVLSFKDPRVMRADHARRERPDLRQTIGSENPPPQSQRPLSNKNPVARSPSSESQQACGRPQHEPVAITATVPA